MNEKLKKLKGEGERGESKKTKVIEFQKTKNHCHCFVCESKKWV